MTITRRAALVVLVLSLVASRASADLAHGGGSVTGEGGERVWITVTQPGSNTPSHPHGSAAPLIRYDLTWTTLGDGPAHTGDLSGLCLVGGTPPNVVFGFQYRQIGTDIAGNIVVDRLLCVPFANGIPGKRPDPPPPPRPPTVGEAWASAHLPTPQVLTDPPARGITGLDTRIRTSGPTDVTIGATIRGYTIIGTATLDHFAISVDGDPISTATSSHYMFETKGRHTITVAAVWRGRATLQGNELTAPVVIPDIGTATITATRAYQVNEVRSVLLP